MFLECINRKQTRFTGGCQLDEKYMDSKMIERIIREKIRKQQLAIELESVDENDLLALIDELNGEHPEELPNTGKA